MKLLLWRENHKKTQISKPYVTLDSDKRFGGILINELISKNEGECMLGAFLLPYQRGQFGKASHIGPDFSSGSKRSHSREQLVPTAAQCYKFRGEKVLKTEFQYI